MPVDNLFDRQQLYEIIYEREPVQFFLKRFFNATPEISNETLLRLEYYKSGKIASAYVGRREQGNFVESTNLQSKAIEPPYLKPRALSSVTTRNQRNIGENPFASTTSNQERKSQDIAIKLAELERQIQRAEELQCAEILSLGKINARNIEGKVLRTINFDVPDKNQVSLKAAERWTANNVDISALGRKAHILVSQESGLTIDTCVMGTDASDAFFASDKIDILLQTTQPNFAAIQEQYQNMGVIYHGRIGAVDYFTYAASFKIGKKTFDVWDPKKVVYGSKNSGARMMYALPEHEEAVATDRFPDNYSLDDPSGTIVQLHCAPLANPHYIDGFYTAKVVA